MASLRLSPLFALPQGLLAAAFCLTLPTLVAAEDSSPVRAEPRGRLPSYFAQVVTPQQKEQVYQAQAEYEQQIDELEAKIEALEKKRDDAVRALLTAEQRKQVDQLASAAKAKRAERKAKEKKEEAAAVASEATTSAPAAPARPAAKSK